MTTHQEGLWLTALGEKVGADRIWSESLCPPSYVLCPVLRLFLSWWSGQQPSWCLRRIWDKPYFQSSPDTHILAPLWTGDVFPIAQGHSGTQVGFAGATQINRLQPTVSISIPLAGHRMTVWSVKSVLTSVESVALWTKLPR